MPWPHCTSTHPNALILSRIEHQRVAYRGKSDAKLLTISLTAKQFSKKLCLRARHFHLRLACIVENVVIL